MKAYRKTPEIGKTDSSPSYSNHEDNPIGCIWLPLVIVISYFVLSAIIRVTSNSGSKLDQIVCYGTLICFVTIMLLGARDLNLKSQARKAEKKKETLVWPSLPGVLAGCSAVITAIAVLILAFHTAETYPSAPLVTQTLSDHSITTMQKEITFRLHEIRTFLDQEDPMTKGVLYGATARLWARGIGISTEFKDTQLRTLLFEFEQVTSKSNLPYVQKIRGLFDELAELRPKAPFSEADLADSQKVRLARDKFEEIEREWRNILDN